MTITLFDVLVFIGGLILGVALGALAKRSIGLVILLLIFIGIAVCVVLRPTWEWRLQ